VKLTPLFLFTEKYEQGARDFWELFYSRNQNQFFKERNYLWHSFPQLDNYQTLPSIQPDQIVFMEVGCGTGSTLIPIMKRYPHYRFIAFDFSAVAVEVMQQNPDFDQTRCTSFCCDVSNNPIPNELVPPASIDLASMIFTLSAISPQKMSGVLHKVFEKLKCGGYLLIRDYGVCDLAHIRFLAKQGRKLEDHFYVRGDGTRAYFFTTEQMTSLLEEAGFKVESAIYDCRELKNRKRQILMPRVWVHAIAKKDTDARIPKITSSSD
jgi:methyltransferase-like protein 6